MAERLFVDTNVFLNFAVVERLDLLQEFAYRLVWTDTVHAEVSNSVGHEPRLAPVLQVGWMSAPLAFGHQELTRIFGIRRILAHPADPPSKHLGEAETIYAMERDTGECALLTDDRPAADLAKQRGLVTRDTAWLLRDLHSMGTLACPEAYELLCLMADSGRGVRVPTHHSAIC